MCVRVCNAGKSPDCDLTIQENATLFSGGLVTVGQREGAQ